MSPVDRADSVNETNFFPLLIWEFPARSTEIKSEKEKEIGARTLSRSRLS